MKGNAKNYSGNDSKNYSPTKEYDGLFSAGVGAYAGATLALAATAAGGITMTAVGAADKNWGLLAGGIGTLVAGDAVAVPVGAVVGGYIGHKCGKKK